MNRTLKTILANTGLGSLISTLAIPINNTTNLLLATIGLTVLFELIESIIGSLLGKLFKRP